VVEVDHLTKYYGTHLAVDDISFSVETGEILGFLGPNGAGKSTSMKIIAGFLSPTEGAVRINGFDIVDQSLDARRQIGYLPEHPPLYLDMTVKDYLEFAASIRGIPRASIKDSVASVVERCGLEKYYTAQCNALSKGYRQRVGIAQAMVHDPAVLILDEPTIGLDPIQIIEIREVIKKYGGDHTVILSTHILPEVEVTCERLVIINDGVLAAQDSTMNLREQAEDSHSHHVTIGGDISDIKSTIRNIDGVRSVKATVVSPGITRLSIESEGNTEVSPLIAQAVADAGLALHELKSRSLSLEEIFINVTMN
jgi:ABC-2 type transport system ATP-binding protein